MFKQNAACQEDTVFWIGGSLDGDNDESGSEDFTVKSFIPEFKKGGCDWKILRLFAKGDNCWRQEVAVLVFETFQKWKLLLKERIRSL